MLSNIVEVIAYSPYIRIDRVIQYHRGVIWGAGGPSPKEKEKKKKERKKEKREKREKKKKKKGTMNNVKLQHIKCCFFQFFNSPVA